MVDATRIDIRSRIFEQILQDPGNTSDDAFNRVALSLFAYQFAHCAPYQRLCQEAGRNSTNVQDWREIPPVPIMAFKYMNIACRPVTEACRIFRSSGTTHGAEYRSTHYLYDLAPLEAAITSSFERHLLPKGPPMPMVILTPSPEELPDSSLSFMMEAVRKHFGSPSSDFYIREGKLHAEGLVKVLEVAKEPVLLLGTSFSFVHFLDFLKEKSLSLRLPSGSCLMDTGGFKGKSREIPRDTLYAMYHDFLGIPEIFCVNEYGMAEMSSQFYDAVAGVVGARVFFPPPQVRIQVLDPVSMMPAPTGQSGLLCFYDLANLDSALALLTQDIGREVAGGFQLIGRADDAELKGCSLIIDGLLQGS